jgi:hypothetical protein
MRRWILLLFGLVVGCGGGGPLDNAAEAPIEAPDSGEPPPAATPLLPAVEGEVIGFPGAAVPGLDASYVTTGLGWLGADDDVIFEGVIQWRATLELGCGILRRRGDGTVNAVLMQGQVLPGTGGGRVKHPSLPLEARGETLVIPALVDGGTIARGLFAVPRGGGAPVLLASETTGEFVAAAIDADGTVVAEVEDDDATSILVIPAGGEPRVLCDGCAPGFSTDGASVVVRQAGRAVAFDLDGAPHALLGAGDAAPGANGLVTGIRAAWVTADGGAFVVHATTDDADTPDVLVRLADGAAPEVVAACGAPAPGTAGVFETIEPAAGRSTDVLFGAKVDDPARATAVFRAPPGQDASLLAATGDAAADLDAELGIGPRDVVAGDGARTAFGASVLRDGLAIATGVFVADGNGSTTRVVTTGAPLAARAKTTVARFLFPLRDAVDVHRDGRTLVHVGLVEERRPDATLGALLLVR